ncbi:MAG: TldD/PmbA family protein [Syntrophomonas sp.]
MLDRSLLNRILEEALRHGGDWAEVYVEEKHNSSVICEDSRIEKINQGFEQGVGIRVVQGERTAYVSSNQLDESDLLKAARLAGLSVKGSGEREKSIQFDPAARKNTVDQARYPEAINIDKKVELVMSADRVARGCGAEIRQVSIGLADLSKSVQIANSWGEVIEEQVNRVRWMINAIAARDALIQTGSASSGGTCGWELLNRASITEQASQAAWLALKMLDAEPAPAGRMPVVMAAQAGGTMVHEACGHGLEADLVQKGLSVYSRKGAVVAAPGVSVVDDPTLDGRYGSYRFDDEGQLAHPTYLIKDGILEDYLYDRMCARREGRQNSCNGRRESYQDKPIPRMSNTMIMPGEDDPGEIIRSTRNGLLVKKMGGGQVNTINGDFVFDVQEGYLIQNGQIGPLVRGATLTGNGPQVLMNIDRIGSDLGFGIGVCGKDGQGVPVADAQPTIRIKELVVGGTAGRGPKKLYAFSGRHRF